MSDKHETYRFFSADAPPLRNLVEVQQIVDFFGLNWKNVVLMTSYVIIFAFLTFLALRWVSLGFTEWGRITKLGWLFAAFPLFATALVGWRFYEEDVPRLDYQRLPELYLELELSEAEVVDFSFPFAMGGTLGARRIFWQQKALGISGTTPYLPGRLIARMSQGTKLWLLTDPKRRIKPLVIGAKP
jgi:hypothetical protein